MSELKKNGRIWLEDFRNKRKELHEPGMIYENNFEGERSSIPSIADRNGEQVIISGRIKDVLYRKLKEEFTLVIISLVDKAGNHITIKLIIYRKFEEELRKNLQNDICICACGRVTYDFFIDDYSIASVHGIKKLK